MSKGLQVAATLLVFLSSGCCAAMKSLLILLLALYTPAAFAQVAEARAIAWVGPARDNFSETTTESLAYQLTAHLRTEREKVQAIFYWITHNIDYKVVAPLNSSRGERRRQPVFDDDTALVLKPLDHRVADQVLEKREAVCDGYARLFKVLCDHAGLKAEMVSGYARPGGMPRRNFRANHSWNAVMIDSAWHLLDATWASGYTNLRGDVFIRHYDETYFLAPPQQFIRDHYPEDPAWTLLPEPPMIREFHQGPFRHTSFTRQRIRSFSPSSGVIQAQLGETIVLELETLDDIKKLEVWDSPFGDPRRHTGPIWLNYPEKPAKIKGDKISYAYTVHSPHVRWLYVVYNGESVLQYRLNVAVPQQETVAEGEAK